MIRYPHCGYPNENITVSSGCCGYNHLEGERCCVEFKHWLTKLFSIRRCSASHCVCVCVFGLFSAIFASLAFSFLETSSHLLSTVCKSIRKEKEKQCQSPDEQNFLCEHLSSDKQTRRLSAVDKICTFSHCQLKWSIVNVLPALERI